MGVGTASLDTIAQLAAPPAFVVSLVLLWVYLRAVKRSMMRQVEAARPPAPDTDAAATVPHSNAIELVAAAIPGSSIVRRAWQGPFTSAAVHIAAGLVYAVTMALLWAHLTQQGYDWRGIVLFALYFAWPLVIVVSLTATVAWRATAAVLAVYVVVFCIGAAWLTAGTGITPSQVALTWWNANGIGTLIELTFLLRPIRAMGPIVVALMMTATAGIFAMAELLSDQYVLNWVALAATQLGFSGKFGGIAAGLIVIGFAAICAALAGFIMLRGLGSLYRAHWISDQSIQIDAVWLIFAITQAPASQPLAGLAAFIAYKIVLWIGFHLLRLIDAPDEPSPRLLLLRVFSLGKRSARLFDAFSLLWRYKGSVRMITGPDLAKATVEPHEFLDFLAGRLQRRFITGPDVLDRRIAEMQPKRDLDGRFRVSAFFCHADTWQMVLRRLAGDCDLVLMDMRGFSATNKGCAYELDALLDIVRLDRILLVVDELTDEDFLTGVLQSGWTKVSPQSPNRGDATPRVRLYRLDHARESQMGRLVATVASAYT